MVFSPCLPEKTIHMFARPLPVAGREDVRFPPRQSVPSQQFSPLPRTAAPPIVSFSPITSFVLSATAFGMEEGKQYNPVLHKIMNSLENCLKPPQRCGYLQKYSKSSKKKILILKQDLLTQLTQFVKTV